MATLADYRRKRKSESDRFEKFVSGNFCKRLTGIMKTNRANVRAIPASSLGGRVDEASTDVIRRKEDFEI